MQKEKEITTAELEKLAAGLAETFIQRWDMYPQQMENGSYICKKESLTQDHVVAHLKGEITLGVFFANSGEKGSPASFVLLADGRASILSYL